MLKSLVPLLNGQFSILQYRISANNIQYFKRIKLCKSFNIDLQILSKYSVRCRSQEVAYVAVKFMYFCAFYIKKEETKHNFIQNFRF